MAVNKVTYAGETLIDLTSSTVTASTLLTGYKAFDRAGNAIDGALRVVTVRTGSADPGATLGSDGDLYLKLAQ